MAGTMIPTDGERTRVKKCRMQWISDASGDVNSITHPLEGTILRVVTVPDPTDQPTASYDVILEDEDGIDLLAGQGANRSNVSSEHVAPAVLFTDGASTSIAPPVVSGDVELKISNAGNAKAGHVTIYYR